MPACLSPGGPNTYSDDEPAAELLVGTVHGVLELRRDGPRSEWRVVRQGLVGLHVSALLWEPSSRRLFAGVHGGGLYASDDGGQNWTRNGHGLSYEHVYTLAARRHGDGVVLYAGTEPAHLFRSLDGGESWQECSTVSAVPGAEGWTFPPPPHVAHVKHVAFDPRDEGTLFVSIEQGGLLKSVDEGRSWRALSGFYEDVHRIVPRPSNPDVLYMSGGDGLYCSSNGGEAWEQMTTRSMEIGYPDALVLSPGEDVLYIAGAANRPRNWPATHEAHGRVARTRDGGQTWEMLANGLPERMHGNVEALSLSAWPGGFGLFAGTSDGEVYASEDGGDRWEPIASKLPPISKNGHHLLLIGGAVVPPDAT